MSRLLLIGLLLNSFIAQSRTAISSNYFNDTFGLRLLDLTDTIHIESLTETQNAPVAVQYLLKTTRSGDTLSISNSTYRAVFPVPYELFTALESPPETVFPFPNATPLNDLLYPFKIVPVKKDQRLAGITTFDLALMSRHVLGVQTFTSPYKLIAADVNKDGSVDGSDILSLRRLILHIDTAFRLSPHWVFIPSTYTMPSVVPPIDSIPQAYYFNAYTTSLPNPFAFTTIKIGDVNNSYRDTTSALPTSVQPRNRTASLILTTENKRLEKGKTYKIDLKCTKSERFIALQGAWSMGTVGSKNAESIPSLDNISSQSLTNFDEQNINILSNNQAAFSWNAVSDKFFEKNATIFTIKFKANSDGNLSDILKIQDDVTENLVYTEGGETRKIELQFTEKTKDFYVSQNEPNPFTDETSVKIDINTENDEAIPAKWAIFDGIGHLVYQKSETFKSGSSVLRLESKTMGLSKSGLYFMKVETALGVQTIKLLKL